jgi:hypothetical protein
MAINNMKTNTAPGPDGFPVQFYKEFWAEVKLQVFEMLEDMFAGRLDLGRLNYGVFTRIFTRLKMRMSLNNTVPYAC